MKLETKYGIIEGTVEEFRELLEGNSKDIDSMILSDKRLYLPDDFDWFNSKDYEPKKDTESEPNTPSYMIAPEAVKGVFGKTIVKRGTVIRLFRVDEQGSFVYVDTLGTRYLGEGLYHFKPLEGEPNIGAMFSAYKECEELLTLAHLK